MANHSADKPKGGLLRSILEFVVVIVVALLLAWGITTFVCKPYQIPSESMLHTIEVGDRVLSEKISYYGGTPQQGEIVTFESVDGEIDPQTGGPRVLIKRCIATAGQTVLIRHTTNPDYDGKVYVDGVALEEDYTLGESCSDGFVTNGEDIEVTVPDGCIWCMGDNRENSADSRDFGPVPIENVTGHAVFTYWPISRIGKLK